MAVIRPQKDPRLGPGHINKLTLGVTHIDRMLSEDELSDFCSAGLDIGRASRVTDRFKLDMELFMPRLEALLHLDSGLDLVLCE